MIPRNKKFGSSYACFGCVIDIKRHKKMPPSAHYTLKKCIIRRTKKNCVLGSTKMHLVGWAIGQTGKKKETIADLTSSVTY
jgi:hypothetical protein